MSSHHWGQGEMTYDNRSVAQRKEFKSLPFASAMAADTVANVWLQMLADIHPMQAGGVMRVHFLCISQNEA